MYVGTVQSFLSFVGQPIDDHESDKSEDGSGEKLITVHFLQTPIFVECDYRGKWEQALLKSPEVVHSCKIPRSIFLHTSK